MDELGKVRWHQSWQSPIICYLVFTKLLPFLNNLEYAYNDRLYRKKRTDLVILLPTTSNLSVLHESFTIKMTTFGTERNLSKFLLLVVCSDLLSGIPCHNPDDSGQFHFNFHLYLNAKRLFLRYMPDSGRPPVQASFTGSYLPIFICLAGRRTWTDIMSAWTAGQNIKCSWLCPWPT